ncbi:hypothetical protein FXO38_08775 [Capsicum annuum]|nr:hypothetical protein FXO37_11750 [Capsicum annuum]KAF3667146.1 hypothetical protein FXO38_08775 [Capsicum annuum]
MLTWEGATVVACMMVGYADFVVILWYELHDRAFGELTNLPFPYMIQSLWDEVGVPEIPGVDERGTCNGDCTDKTMKSLAPPDLSKRSTKPAAVPSDHTKGLIDSIKLVDTHGGDVGVSVDIEIGVQREAPNSSMLTISSNFLQSLVDNKAIDARLRVVAIEMTTFYEKMRSGVRTGFKQAEAA